ncbi:MAG: DUF21 domain-containing protein, partial [Armatimonadetes bacterium]|nr:DUF21 domain-containing protein [Armatimonadota bacterium]
MEAEGDPNSLMQVVSLGMEGSVILIIFLLLLNAFFAMAEIALVSVRKTRIRQLVEEGVPHARNVQKLLEDPTQFLATIQIGVTLVGFFASAAGAVTFAKPLAGVLSRIPLAIVADHANGIAVVLVTLVIGFLSLTIGEISPKSLALQHAERISLWVAGPLTLLSYIM